MKAAIEKLIFVYNADSGTINAALDAAHKLLSPSTYQCKLCELTYGAFSENKQWKAFREASKITFEFLHRNEFEHRYPSLAEKVSYPVIFTKREELEVFVSQKELHSISSLEALMQTVQDKLLETPL